MSMMKTNILIIAVIYNTFPETERFLQSIPVTPAGDLHILLVDNSTIEPPAGFIDTAHASPNLTYLKTGKNTGYFHGAATGLDHFTATEGYYPEWILVTNVDILFTPGFFDRLKEINADDALGLVAPAILSHRWKTDYNPAMLTRLSKRRLKFYLFIYQSTWLHNGYLLAAYLFRWLKGLAGRNQSGQRNQHKSGLSIYAPHGSCLVFNQRYFRSGGSLQLPHFLFGEEIFVGETAARNGVTIRYQPELVIDDHEHASTGFFVSRTTNTYYYQSIKSILDHFYQDET
jgi:GT2 family glycosyltransferase